MKYLTLNFWFKVYPESIGYILLALIFVAAILFAGSAVAIWLKRKDLYKGLYREVWPSLFRAAVTNSLIALWLWFFNFEMIPVFSSRFWFLLWFILLAWYGIGVYRKIKALPLAKQGLTERQKLAKYIP